MLHEDVGDYDPKIILGYDAGDYVYFIGELDGMKRERNVNGTVDPFKYLNPNGRYRVKKAIVHSWHSKVVLEDYPNVEFNSIFFDVNPYSPMAEEYPEPKRGFYVRKPIPIEARQITEKSEWGIKQWAGQYKQPDGTMHDIVYASPVLEPTPENPKGVYWQVYTLEGIHTCISGDYIIRGVRGEFYPCKKDIFEETYEEVKN